MLNILLLVKTRLPCQGTKNLIFRGALPTVRVGVVLLLLALPFSGCTLRPMPPPPGGKISGLAVSKTVRTAIGTRYTYGGEEPSRGFDCSGLVCWVYEKYGIAVPRTAREQSDFGHGVSKKNLRPGDLVVFKISGGWHTGIYTGDGKFVHSPSSGKNVREDDLNSKFFSGKFITGRRLRQME